MTIMEASQPPLISHRLLLLLDLEACLCLSPFGIISSLIAKTCFAAAQLWKRFRGSDKPPENFGPSREYNVDMIPKVLGSFIDYSMYLFLFIIIVSIHKKFS